MTKYENECVGCPTEMRCLGNSCPYINVLRNYCDYCGASAIYKIDGDDFCEECANEYLQDIFDDLTITEKAEALEIDISKYD